MPTGTTAISAEKMKLVLDVSRLLTVTADLDTLLLRICEAATTLVSAERASLFLHDASRNELWTKVALGAREIRIPCDAGIAGHVFSTNQILEVPDPYNDPRFNREVDRRSGFVTRNLLTVPLRSLDNSAIGVIQVVNRIGGGFTEVDHQMIELLAGQAGVAVQRHQFQQEVIRSAGLRHEMDLAHQVQAAMIPTRPPEVPNLKAVGWSRPASVTGGDAYDLWRLADDRLGIFLGDASGHGIAPALIVSQARTLLRSLSEINPDPTWLLTRVNNRLANDLEAGRFVTAFFGCMSSDGVLSWASAGHGPILYREGASGKFIALDPQGPPIGILPEYFADPGGEVRLAPGGLFVVLSDGIVEARSASGELFELGRLLHLLETCSALTPEEILSVVRESIRQWQGKEEPVDDQTMVLVQRRE